MKIWIDITNAPHVNFFERLLVDWRAAGHEVEVTARPLSNTLPLLNRCGIEYSIVGEHYGANPLLKLIGFARRCVQLWKFLHNRSIDIAVSQSSFYSPVVAKFLRCHSIYTNDNEHAKGNLAGFLFADIILLPEPLRAWASKRFFSHRVRYYPGIKEGIYIHPLAGRIGRQHKDDTASRQRIVFRPEPWTAQYHTADKTSFHALIEHLAQDFDVLVLPRGEEQAVFFSRMASKRVQVQRAPLSIQEIASICDIFIGAGGSMSREFAYLGVPTISTYRGTLLAVDRYLIEARVMYHTTDISSSAVQKALTHLSRTSVPDDLIRTGEDAYQVIRNSINFF